MKDAPDGCYAEFENLIRETARSHLVRVIAEEMSAAALGSCKSLCKEVAEELGVAHIFCDPDNGERVALCLSKIDDAGTWGRVKSIGYRNCRAPIFPSCSFVVQITSHLLPKNAVRGEFP